MKTTEEKTATLLRLPIPLKQWLDALAKSQDRSVNAQLVQIIKAAKRAEDGEAAEQSMERGAVS